MDTEQITLIWITRVVVAVIAFLIAFGVWRFMRRERMVNLPPQPVYQPPKHIELPEKTIVLTVLAKPGRVLDNLQLFQVMHELGFAFSENRIFGYFAPQQDNDIAFKVVNIKRPHTFDGTPEKMRPTNGLMAVMNLPVGDGDKQLSYFQLMLSVLDEVRERLGAELCDLNRIPLRNSKLYDIQKEIEQFEQTYQTLIQNDYRRNH